MLAALLIGGGVAGFETAVGATVTPTAKVVVRPVTSTGHVRAGFTMVSEPTGLVDCNAQDPSPGAVSRNIEFCSPSAEYAIACWKAAAPHRVLCMRDPRSTRVVRIPRTGTFAPTGLAPLSQRAPLAITLGGGAYCSIRDGGAWPTLRSHPSWVGTYSCNNGDAVWAPPTATHNGVNESSASWTVRTARSSGVGPVVTRHVVRAYFVGTYPG
jgi:hypothetical protein